VSADIAIPEKMKSEVFNDYSRENRAENIQRNAKILRTLKIHQVLITTDEKKEKEVHI
jgi:hydroxymethylpyrimidine/phosphomethylpyrimidine kinase